MDCASNSPPHTHTHIAASCSPSAVFQGLSHLFEKGSPFSARGKHAAGRQLLRQAHDKCTSPHHHPSNYDFGYRGKRHQMLKHVRCQLRFLRSFHSPPHFLSLSLFLFRRAVIFSCKDCYPWRAFRELHCAASDNPVANHWPSPETQGRAELKPA